MKRIEIIVHSRNEWKTEMNRLFVLKNLSRVGLIGKESHKVQPREVLNEWTFLFFDDENGQEYTIELDEISGPAENE